MKKVAIKRLLSFMLSLALIMGLCGTYYAKAIAETDTQDTEYSQIPVTIKWNHNIVLPSVDLSLYRNGELYQTIHLTEKDNVNSLKSTKEYKIWEAEFKAESSQPLTIHDEFEIKEEFNGKELKEYDFKVEGLNEFHGENGFALTHIFEGSKKSDSLAVEKKILSIEVSYSDGSAVLEPQLTYDFGNGTKAETVSMGNPNSAGVYQYAIDVTAGIYPKISLDDKEGYILTNLEHSEDVWAYQYVKQAEDTREEEIAEETEEKTENPEEEKQTKIEEENNTEKTTEETETLPKQEETKLDSNEDIEPASDEDPKAAEDSENYVDEIPVSVTWEDVKPFEYVDLVLTITDGDNKNTKTITLKAADFEGKDSWSGKFIADVDKGEHFYIGDKYQYNLDESYEKKDISEYEGYTYLVSGNIKDGAIVRNLQPKHITIVAVFADGNDDITPVLNYQFKDEDTITKSMTKEEEDGTYSYFIDTTGKELESVYIDSVDGYKLSGPEVDEEKDIWMYTFSPDVPPTPTPVVYDSISVKKEWSDVTPAKSVDITLYKNSEKYSTITLSANNNWKGQFYPKKSGDLTEDDYFNIVETIDGQEIESAGYYNIISGNAEYGYTVTNYEKNKDDDTGYMTLHKFWWVNTGSQAEFTLYLGDKPYRTVVLDASYDSGNGYWDYKFDNLPLHDSEGRELEYTLQETPINGYRTHIGSSGFGHFTVINTYTGERHSNDTTTTSDVNTKSANTGDDNNIASYLIALLCGISVVGGIVYNKRKES